jgi:hypothetical protein
MLSRREYQSIEAPEALLHMEASLPDADDSVAEATTKAPTQFHGQFADSMEMHAPAQTVAEYLNAHHKWFCRCAHPMKVEPLGKNGYALVIGRFGAFGYEVEPKVGLELLPPDKGVYCIKTIPVPDYVALGYEVDFKSSMELVETQASSSTDSLITRVEWQLELAVEIHFPKLIHRLPKSLIQSTGDRLLHNIVRQVSRRLTYKVQEDFHKSLGLPFGPKSGALRRERGRGEDRVMGRGRGGEGEIG